MLKLDFNTVGATCNSLNALEGKYRFLEPDQGTSSILHNAQELIWLLWTSLEESKGVPTCQQMKEILKKCDYIHSGKPIGIVLHKDDEAITVQLTDEAKHDPKIMELFGFNRVTSMSFEVKEQNNDSN